MHGDTIDLLSQLELLTQLKIYFTNVSFITYFCGFSQALSWIIERINMYFKEYQTETPKMKVYTSYYNRFLMPDLLEKQIIWLRLVAQCKRVFNLKPLPQ